MREIKFRGKLTDNGEWIYGNFVKDYDARCYITTPLANSHKLVLVTPETVGQFTGLKDRNGVEIYEGDIIFFQPFGTHSNDRIVKYKDGMFVGELVRNGYDDGPLGKSSLDMYEVIGNIHDKEEQP